MPDKAQLRPATAKDIAQALAFASRFDGRKRVHQTNEFMARFTAQRLVEHFERSGFVLMQKPSAPAPSAPFASGQP